jgi:thioesterase domain-containing protein
VTLFKAAEDLSPTPLDATLGWSDWADGGVDVQIVPGNHATMVYKPNVETLAEKLAACIDRVRPDLEYVAEGIVRPNELIKDSQ